MQQNNIFTDRSSITKYLNEFKSKGNSIGFVPTMGALHEGHLALVERAYQDNDIVVVSIFVNPTQFNNPADFEKYPKMQDKDIALLLKFQNIVIFIPSSIEEIYPKNQDFIKLDLGNLDQVLEGEHRPGHFAGVTHVVYNFFEIVHPTRAYFGKKDYQQLSVIRFMTNHFKLPIEIVACPTLREKSGLAMSSRNLRLSEKGKQDSLIIFETLQYVNSLKQDLSPSQAIKKSIEYFEKGKLKLEYLSIIDGDTFNYLNSEWGNNPVCCIAAYCEDIRLIDNLEIS